MQEASTLIAPQAESLRPAGPDPAMLRFRDIYRETFFEAAAVRGGAIARPARRFDEQWRDLPKLGEYRTVQQLNWNAFADLSALAEFCAATDAIAEALTDGNVRTLAISSCRRDEGRTSIALHLCRDQAYRLGRRVALLDYDFQRRELKDVLPAVPIYTLKDALEGSASFEKVGILSLVDRFMIMPSTGAFPRNHKQAPWMSEFIARTVPECIDLLVLDLPPYFGQEQTVRAVLPHLDAALLVHSKASDREFGQLARIVDEAGCKVLGYVRNKPAR